MTLAIYTTGAFIRKEQRSDGMWQWVIEEFDEDTFMNGNYVDVQEIAETEDELILGVQI